MARLKGCFGQAGGLVALVGVCIIVLSALLVTAGCYPEFVRPIAASEAREIDEEMFGNWVRRLNTREIQQLSFYPREWSGTIDIVFAYGINLRDIYGGANVEVFQGYRAVVDGVNYLCFRPRFKDNPNLRPSDVRWYIAAYEMTDDELIIQMLSREKIADLVEEGVLAGEPVVRNPDEGVFYETVLVMSPSEVLTDVIDDVGLDDLTERDALHTIVFQRELEDWRVW